MSCCQHALSHGGLLKFLTRIPGTQTVAELIPVFYYIARSPRFPEKVLNMLSFCKGNSWTIIIQALKTCTFFYIYKCGDMTVLLYLWPGFCCTALLPAPQGILRNQGYYWHEAMGTKALAQMKYSTLSVGWASGEWTAGRTKLVSPHLTKRTNKMASILSLKQRPLGLLSLYPVSLE